MLVLSRNKNQGIHFPGLGISVEILEINAGKVKVGIDAPIDVRILRDELVGKELRDSEANFRMRLPKTMQHELRNALNEISLRLHVCLRRLQKNPSHAEADIVDAEEMFQAILRRLEHVGGNESFDMPVAETSDVVDTAIVA